MEDFERRLNTPRSFARSMGAGLAEYLTRALSHQAAIAEPKDLAWLLASYARDGLSRVDRIDVGGDALAALRGALWKKASVFASRAIRDYPLFPLHPRADALLRRVLRMGALGATSVLRLRLLPSTGARPSGTCARRCSPRLFQEVAAPNRLQLFDLVEVLNWTVRRAGSRG